MSDTDTTAGARPASPRRTEPRFVAALLLLGLVVGLIWRLLGGSFASWGQPEETSAAYDVLFIALAAVAGVASGAIGVLLGARDLLVRFAGALLGSGAAAALAWGTGLALGGSPLHSKGALVVWPLLTSATFFAASLTRLVRTP